MALKWVEITGNGLIALTPDKGKDSPKKNILNAKTLGTATVTIGYLDNEGNFTKINASGVLLTEEQIQIEMDIQLYALIASWSVIFSIGVSTQR